MRTLVGRGMLRDLLFVLSTRPWDSDRQAREASICSATAAAHVYQRAEHVTKRRQKPALTWSKTLSKSKAVSTSANFVYDEVNYLM